MRYYTKLLLKMLFEGELGILNFFKFLRMSYANPEKAVLRKYNYDVIAAFKNLQRITGRKPEETNIFFDMDNTIFKYSVDRNDALSLKLQNFRGFFKNLEPFEEAPSVLAALVSLGYKVYILSSCMNDTYCMQEKRESLRKHFPFLEDENIVFVMNGQNKAEEIAKRGISVKDSILVDDYHVNLENWIRGGGAAIKKTYSGKKRDIPQVVDLRELFSILGYGAKVESV